MADKKRPEGIKWSDIVKKAQEDPEFKKKLLKDPKAAIEEASGKELPKELQVYVHEQTEHSVHLVLPLPESPEARSKAVFL